MLDATDSFTIEYVLPPQYMCHARFDFYAVSSVYRSGAQRFEHMYSLYSNLMQK